MFEKIIQVIIASIVVTIAGLGYAGIVIAMAIESACIPLPSEIIMPFSGFLVGQGRFTLLGISLAGALGCVAGSVLAYYLGKKGGRPLIERYGKYILFSRRDLELADRWFNRYGDVTVFFSRLLPVIRTFISFPAGIAEMNFPKFLIYTFIGSWPWCYGLGWLGLKLGEKWDKLGPYFHKFDALIGVFLVLGIAFWIYRHWKNIKPKHRD